VAGLLTYIFNQIVIIKRKLIELHDILRNIYTHFKIFVIKMFELKLPGKQTKLRNASTLQSARKVLPPRTRKKPERFGIDYNVY
jgi:hypothetical protein